MTDAEHSAEVTQAELAAQATSPCLGVPCADSQAKAEAQAQAQERERTRGEARRVSLLLGVLFGLTGSGSSAAAVVLPALSGDLGLPASSAAWVISGYALTLAVCTAVYGRIADLVGVRAPLVAGLLLMAAGSFGAAAADSLPVLLAARLLQGAGAAATPVLATALLSSRYEGRIRATALGRMAGVAAALSSLGPLAGGALEAWLGWRAVLMLPALAVLLVPLVVRAAPAKGPGGQLDGTGAALVAAVATGLVLLVQSPSTGRTVALIGAALLAVATPLLVRHVRRRPDGFLPRSVVRNRVVVQAALAGASLPAAWFALLLAVPATLAARGWSPLSIGLGLIPSAVVALICSRQSRRLVERVGARRSLLVGTAIAAVSVALAAVAEVEAVSASWLLVASVAGVTAAFGLGQPALIARVSDATSIHVRGIALGVATLLFLTGGGVGSALVGGLTGVVTASAALAVVALLPLAATGLALLDPAAGPAPPV
jgi:MFS family permease